LKQDVSPLLDGVGPEVQIIGALNTIVPEVSVDEMTGKEVTRLIGRNTDCLGMILVLKNAGDQRVPGQQQSGLVIGGGGTSRAAIYALHEMQYSPIYLLGRNIEKMEKLQQDFPADYNVKVIKGPQSVDSLESIPTCAIGTIPADKPIDSMIQETLAALFSKTENASQSVLLEMAYKPPVTALIELAQKAGWKTVNGLEVLVGQGVHQFEYWTGIKPFYATAREAVMDGY
jgi:pentafunctional AROM polypeptide